jgi:hypothetical protein
MAESQSYIVRLLRKVETALEDGRLRGHRVMMDKVVYRLSHAEDMHGALERLYAVRGYDRFALRLMWLLEHTREQTDRLETSVVDYDVENLIEELKGSENPERDGGKYSAQEPIEHQEAFHDSLHRFGRILDDVRRRSFDGNAFRGVEEDALHQILAENEALQNAAGAINQHDVVKFTKACSSFVTYALDNGLLHDVRVMNMLDHANLTLQTVLATAGTEEYDSLQKSIELLQNPKELLD